MGTLDGKFSPDNYLSEDEAKRATAKLEIKKNREKYEEEEEEKENREKRDQFTKKFGLDALLSEYSYEIPGFDKIRDQIIDELMGFVKTKKRFNDPKDKQILMDTVQDKFVKRIEGLKEAS